MVEDLHLSPADRFVHSGEYAEGIHLVDLNLYDSSLFANAGLVTGRNALVIIDAGTSNTTGQIVNYIKYHDLDAREVYIVPTHHHFDHASGAWRLLETFHGRGINAKVVATPACAELLASLPEHVGGAKKLFNRMVGEIKAVPERDIIEIDPRVPYPIDDSRSIELVPTPGHCQDHVSPLVRDGDIPVACFLGEALGINLRKGLSPLPATTAPCYDALAYRGSIHRVKELGAEMAVFSHVGGVHGKENVQKLCDLSISMLDEVTAFVKALDESTSGSGEIPTRDFVTRMQSRYHDYIATCVMDMEVVDNLSFLLVYGLLQSLGMK